MSTQQNNKVSEHIHGGPGGPFTFQACVRIGGLCQHNNKKNKKVCNGPGQSLEQVKVSDPKKAGEKASGNHGVVHISDPPIRNLKAVPFR